MGVTSRALVWVDFRLEWMVFSIMTTWKCSNGSVGIQLLPLDEGSLVVNLRFARVSGMNNE